MTKISYAKSKNLTLGMELELQLINPNDHDLHSSAKELLEEISKSKFKHSIKPEITQSMIEINSKIHESPHEFIKELTPICQFVTQTSNKFNTLVSGGASHPFQFWSHRKIFPTERFQNKALEHGYLAKRFTVFGLHLHIGCANPDDALYLTHVLTRYMPQVIAMSCSSPFYQGTLTGFLSTRSTIIKSQPFSGIMPFVQSWDEFSVFYNKMCDLKMIESMKDVYWDIRPKPDFGTIEIRVCDMPLTLYKAIVIAGYLQTLVRYLLLEKPHKIDPNLYLVYEFNRFQAAHFGYDGDFIDPYTLEKSLIAVDAAKTIRKLLPHAKDDGNLVFFQQIEEWIEKKENDAIILLNIYDKVKSFDAMIEKQCEIWSEDLKDLGAKQ